MSGRADNIIEMQNYYSQVKGFHKNSCWGWGEEGPDPDFVMCYTAHCDQRPHLRHTKRRLPIFGDARVVSARLESDQQQSRQQKPSTEKQAR